MIPRLLHHIWVGPDPCPPHLLAYRAAWLAMHPASRGWAHAFWHDGNLPVLANQWVFEQAAVLVAADRVGQLRADVLRYELLLHFGGVYVDMDLEPVRPIDELLEDDRPFAAWEQDDVWVNNAILGAVPGDRLIGQTVAELGRRVRASMGQGLGPNVLTGPHLLTTMHRRYPLELRVLPQALFYPYAHTELERGRESFPDAYTVHHWEHQRSKRKRPR